MCVLEFDKSVNKRSVNSPFVPAPFALEFQKQEVLLDLLSVLLVIRGDLGSRSHCRKARAAPSPHRCGPRTARQLESNHLLFWRHCPLSLALGSAFYPLHSLTPPLSDLFHHSFHLFLCFIEWLHAGHLFFVAGLLPCGCRCQEPAMFTAGLGATVWADHLWLSTLHSMLCIFIWQCS